LAFDSQSTEADLIFIHPAEQFHAGNCEGGRLIEIEALYGSGSGLDASVILFEEVVPTI
jgi:hypothetical protein